MTSDLASLVSRIDNHGAFKRHSLIGTKGFSLPSFKDIRTVTLTEGNVESIRKKGINVTGELGRGNVISYDNSLQYSGVKISFFGRDDSLIVLTSDKTRLDLRVREHGVVAVFGNTKFVSNLEVFMMGAGSGIYFGSQGSSVGSRYHLEGEGSAILVGNDHMLSWNVEIRNQDGHGIFDLRTRRVLSDWRDVIIDPHVWIGFDCAILKGVRIGTGSIIGAKSILTKTVPPCSAYAGNPAVLRRSYVTWTRSNLVPDDQVEAAVGWADYARVDVGLVDTRPGKTFVRALKKFARKKTAVDI